MIYIANLYNRFLNQIRTDMRGLSFSPDDFNLLIRTVNQELYDDFLDEFETDISNTDSLAFFKIHSYNIPLTASGSVAVGNLPSDYYRMIGKPMILDSDDIERRVDIITDLEDAERQEDYLTQASATHPTCTIGGIDGSSNVQIRVRPNTIATIYLDYMRAFRTGGIPYIPFLDYYINDTTKVITLLAETATPYNLTAGYTYRDGTPGGVAVTVTSLTRDLYWNEGDVPALIGKLMKHAGFQIPDEMLVQGGVAEEIKNT